ARRITVGGAMNGPLTRRRLLQSAAAGFGYMALAGLATEAAAESRNPLATRAVHHPARARRVIFLFMHGGPSHVDTSAPTPPPPRDAGKDLPSAPAPGPTASRKLLASPWKFGQHGESGLWVSELFPEVARHADDLCVLSGMHTEGQSHGQAVLKLHTG